MRAAPDRLLPGGVPSNPAHSRIEVSRLLRAMKAKPSQLLAFEEGSLDRSLPDRLRGAYSAVGDPEIVAKALAAVLGLEYCDVRCLDLSETDFETCHEMLAEEFEVVPLRVSGQVLVVGRALPMSPDQLRRFTERGGWEVTEIEIASPQAIAAAYKRYYKMIVQAPPRRRYYTSVLHKPAPARWPIGSILEAMGYAKRSALDLALAAQAEGDPRRIGKILVAEGVCDADDIARGLSVQVERRFIRISRFKIPDSAISALPLSVARLFQAFPIKRVEQGLIVAGHPHLDPRELSKELELPVVAALVASEPEVREAIRTYYDEDPTVVKLIGLIAVASLRDCKAPGASPATPRIRMRTAGGNFTVEWKQREDWKAVEPTIPPRLGPRIASTLIGLARLNLEETVQPQRRTIQLSAGDRHLDLEVSMLCVAEEPLPLFDIRVVPCDP